ncbi:MAG: carboxypeptidase-like regulatory domain-containing protein [Candidatus Sulfotelmatobacter sp.]
MKITMLMLLVLGCATVCPARVKDYTFDVTGTVSADDGAPLQDVEVTLQVGTPVYEGVKPVNTQRVVTSKGAFIFRCLSHSQSTKYSVTVRKDGYEPQTVSGTAPPNGNFTIRLKKANGEGGGKPGSNNR